MDKKKSHVIRPFIVLMCVLSVVNLKKLATAATGAETGSIVMKEKRVGKTGILRDGLYTKKSEKKYSKPINALNQTGTGAFYTDGGAVYSGHMYSVLKKMLVEGRSFPDRELLEIARRFMAWTNEKGLQRDLGKDLEKFRSGYGPDLRELAGFMGKLLIEADYPMWIDGKGRLLNRNEIRPADRQLTNLDLGNSAKGINGLVCWQNRILQNPESRKYFKSLVRESAAILDPSKNARHADILKTLLLNLVDIGTPSGKTFSNEQEFYGTNDNKIYTNSEISVVAREFLPVVNQVITRTDRPLSITGFGGSSGEKGVYLLRECMNNLKAIGFNPDTLSVEKSLTDLIAHDQWGRERTKDGWAGSFLESAVFLCASSSNMGWLDGGEIQGNEVSQLPHDPRRKHGPGTHTGYMTINDGLSCCRFNMMTVPVLGARLGIYELAFKDGDGENVFRSIKPFNAENRNRFRFYYNQNYPISHVMSGATIGDSGIPLGGNPEGLTDTQLSDQKARMNSYRAFSGDGRDTRDLGTWTINWAVRACFDGEGPYYYKNPKAGSVLINGQTYHRYLRPNGKTYALVNSQTSDYIYPADVGDPIDVTLPSFKENNREKYQRYNRYKSVWNSDYFMVQRNDYYGGLIPKRKKKVFTLDNSTDDIRFKVVEGNSSSGALTYHETVDEADKDRACKTPEEAFFRNFQWTENEKKIVILLPLFMDFNRSLASLRMGFLEPYADLGQGVVFVAFEANGWSGASNLKKFRGNHIWIKKGSNGRSNIPGDSRCELILDVGGVGSILAKEETIIKEVVGSGTFIPGVTSHNLPSLYRLAFPLSPELTRNEKLVVHDSILGSKDFTVGDNIWKRRNAAVPLFISFCAAVDSKTTGYDPLKNPLHGGIQAMISGAIPLIKPMMYYQKEEGSYLRNSWRARVKGKNCGGYIGDPGFMSTADYYESHPDTAQWFGSWGEREHYQPQPMKTLFNIFADSDNRNRETRMDGILPVILEKKILTSLFKLLLSKPNDSDHLYAALEQIATSVKFTKAPGTRINEKNAKHIVYPDWLFAKVSTNDSSGKIQEFSNARPEDIILDKVLSLAIGEPEQPDRKGHGLVQFLETQKKERWKDYYAIMDILEDFLYPKSKYNLLEPSLNITDSLLSGDHPLSDDEIKALIYYAGTFLTIFNDDKDMGKR